MKSHLPEYALMHMETYGLSFETVVRALMLCDRRCYGNRAYTLHTLFCAPGSGFEWRQGRLVKSRVRQYPRFQEAVRRVWARQFRYVGLKYDPKANYARRQLREALRADAENVRETRATAPRQQAQAHDRFLAEIDSDSLVMNLPNVVDPEYLNGIREALTYVQDRSTTMEVLLRARNLLESLNRRFY